MEHNTFVVATGLGLLGANAGALGTFAIARRRVLVVDAMGHAALPGVASAFLLAPLLGWPARSLPLLLAGAALFALAAQASIEGLVSRTRLAADAATGAVLSTFFGLGLVLLGVIQRSGAAAGGLDRWIFGQAATLLRRDVLLFAGLALLSLIALRLTYRALLWTGFDPDQARTAGWSPEIAAALFGLQLGAVTLVALPSVGLLLVLGFLVLPAAAARPLTRRFSSWILLASVIGAAGAVAGALASRALPNLPTGPAIVVTLGTIAALAQGFAPRTGWLAVRLSRARLRRELESSAVNP